MVDTLNKTIVLYRTYGPSDLPPDVKTRLYAVLDLEAESDSPAPSGPR
jgi:hypothetical protein